MTTELTLAALVADVRAAMDAPEPYGPARFRDRPALLALPGIDALEGDEGPKYLASAVAAYIDSRGKTPAGVTLRFCFSLGPPPHPRSQTKRIAAAAEAIPMSADHVRQEILPPAVGALAFALFSRAALRQLGSVEPLGYVATEYHAIDSLDLEDPFVRTTTIRQQIRYTRDRVLVLPLLWFPAASWRPIGRPKATSAGHTYLGAAPGMSNDPREKLHFCFLGTDNRIGDSSTVELQLKGRVPPRDIRRFRTRATDDLDRICLSFQNPTAESRQYRTAIYPDGTMLTPRRKTRWRNVEGSLEAEWHRDEYAEGEMCTLEWRT